MQVVIVVLAVVLAVALWALTVVWHENEVLRREVLQQRERREGLGRAVERLIHVEDRPGR